MIDRPFRTRLCLLVSLGFWLLLAARLSAAPTGPTLHFDYGRGQLPDHPLNHFMYFIPLIAPDPVSVYTNAGNTQCARVLACHCRTNGNAFYAICEFKVVGDGLQRSVFDHSAKIQRRLKELQGGHPLTHQLADISVQGSGSGSVEIDGRLTNGLPTVTEVRLRFDTHGHTTPVSIRLEDLADHNGIIGPENEMVARVNVLTFRRQPGPPEMEVTLDSVKSKNARDNRWQNFVGGLKGMVVNRFLPPLKITPEGQQAMLAFGLALATAQPDYTFPFATRLQNPPVGRP